MGGRQSIYIFFSFLHFFFLIQVIVPLEWNIQILHILKFDSHFSKASLLICGLVSSYFNSSLISFSIFFFNFSMEIYDGFVRKILIGGSNLDKSLFYYWYSFLLVEPTRVGKDLLEH